MPTPVTGAVVPFSQLQSDLYTFLLRVAGIAPESEVGVFVQNMLAAVARAVALLMQLPADLYTFLMGSAGAQLGKGIERGGLSPAEKAWVVSHWQQVLALVGIPSGPWARNAAIQAATWGGTAASASGPKTSTGLAPYLASVATMAKMAPPLLDTASPLSALSALEHSVRAVLAPVSLWTLTAIALPGICGLLIMCAAGTRLGYRQANAALLVRSSGIARFARQGPLGVVSSGSLIAVRPSALGVDRPSILNAGNTFRRSCAPTGSSHPTPQFFAEWDPTVNGSAQRSSPQLRPRGTTSGLSSLSSQAG
jgi:hypothetical protein